MAIEFSVRMPMFRVKYIAWLALESLCRQKGINFEWELIMAEEQIGNEIFGKEKVDKYIPRLKAVGCKRVHYIPLKAWIPLAQKMCLLVENCSKESKYVAFQSADYYSSPGILAAQYSAFKRNPNIDWFTSRPWTVFYDIQTGISKMVRNGAKGSGRACKLKYARLIAPTTRRKGCDKWFYNNIVAIVKSKENRVLREYIDTEQWRYAFNVHGFHNCTLSRGGRMRSGHKKFREVSFDWKKNIPVDILERVDSLKEFIPNHKLGLPKGRVIVPPKPKK